MALTKINTNGVSDSAITSAKIDDGSITNDDIKSDAAITAGKLSATLDLSSKTITLPSASVTAHATTPTLDSPSITGTLFVDDGSTVSHTIGNWSEELTYVITPTNCTVGAVNSSGVFVVTHTSGNPSYTIVATTDSLGLDNSSTVTKNIVMNLSAPTLSSPADVGTATDVVYTITSTDSNDDKIILDMGSSNFTYSSVSVGTASKVGNTVECIGFTTNNPAVTIQFTAEATYSVTAKSVNIAGTYGDSALSSADSITIANWSAYNIDYLVVAGGGGGGAAAGGGGGAGGYRNSYNSETSGGGGSSESAIAAGNSTVYTVTVGSGQPGGSSNNRGTNGSNSVFSTITSTGGGGGGSRSGQEAGNSGGSGGGCSIDGTFSGGSGTSNQGYSGGNASGGSGPGSGGGGAGGTGAQNGGSGGNGGNGVASSISGASVYRGGGGAGSGGGNPGTGGTGGGADGAPDGGTSQDATVNTGGGGGANDGASNTASGGSGVVILRMPTTNYSGTTTGSPSVSTSGSDTILTFNGSGSYTG